MKMNILNKNIILLMIIFSTYGLSESSAQSYTKDSLQIKAYTEIQFKDNNAENIILKKVFCDYCTDFQIEKIGEEALRRADIEKYAPLNRMENGYKKLAIYIRISKDDFASITPDGEIDN